MILQPKHRGAKTRVQGFLRMVQEIDVSLANSFPRPLPEIILAAYPVSLVEIENLTLSRVVGYLDSVAIPHSLVRDDGDEELAGFILYRRRHALLFTEKSGSTGFRAFTLAHELGHFWEFWNKGDGSFEKRDAPQDIQAVQDKINFEEYRANQFAAELLMPLDCVGLLASSYSGDSLLQEMIAMFGVSEIAAQIRLKDLGFI